MNRTRYEGHHAAIQKNEECEDIARYCSASRRKEKGGGGEREEKEIFDSFENRIDDSSTIDPRRFESVTFRVRQRGCKSEH